MRNVRTLMCVAAVAVMGTACQNRITSTLTVNGTPFRPTSCRNGAAAGFFGVEFTDASGARLRLGNTAAGIPTAYYFGGGGAMPVAFGMCGTLTMQNQNSRINNVQNIEGSATLNCSSMGTTLQGSIQFQNCH